jgi:hypothetical protein
MSNIDEPLKSLLARLCVADSTSTSFTTVSEERAFVRELVSVVGAAIAFKSLAKHINDFTTRTTYAGNHYDVYAGQDYTSFNGADVLLNIGNGTLTPGQDIALAMLIRANIPLGEMTNVISHANLLAYIALKTTAATNAASGANATSRPIVEENGTDFTTGLHSSRVYQYDITQFFSATGVSSFKFAPGVSNDDIMFIISKSALYASTGSAIGSGSAISATNVFLKMITQLTGENHPLRSATAIGAGFKAVTASSSGFFYDGNNFTASSGVTFSRDASPNVLVSSTNVIDYVTGGNKGAQTLANTVDTYYLPTNSFTLTLNNYVATGASFTVNGDKLVSDTSLATYSVAELLGFNLSTLTIKGFNKTLPEIIAGVVATTPGSPFTPTRALTDGWTVQQVITAYPLLKDLTESGSKFNAVNVTPNGANSPTDFKLVTLYNPASPSAPYTTDLISKLATMYNSLPGSNAFVQAIEGATRDLPGYVTPTSQGDLTWSTARRLPASIARWIYTTTNEQMAAGHIVGKMSIVALKRLLPDGLSEQDIVKESELAIYANGAITSGLSPETLIAAPYNLTPKAALEFGWPLPLVMNSFSAQALLVKTITNGDTTPTAAITIPQALIGREWVSNNSPIASLNKSVDNIPFKTIKSIKNSAGLPIYSDEEILDAIRAYMNANGNGLNNTNIATFLSDLHLPFAVVKRLIGAPYGSNINVSKADIASMKTYSKAQRRSVYKDIVDAISSLTRDDISTAAFVALGWPVSEWQAYAANPNGVTITISLRDVLGAFEGVSVFDSDSFLITGATLSVPTDQRAIYHTKEERIALVKLFTGKVNPEAAREVESLALGPLEDLDEITL